MSQKVLVWDAPTRVFHWVQALCFLGAYLTSDSEKTRDIHVALGYILFGMIVFRLLWGFVGTRYAKFSSFAYGPSKIISYLVSLFKGKADHFVGHNPIGSVAIWLLLSGGLTLGVTGVMLLQDDFEDIVEEIHDYATNAMLIVIAIHLIGVFASSFLHKENLVRAMITGFKPGEDSQGIKTAYNWLAAMMLVIVVCFGAYYLR
ncbi:MAG: cytochrome b/b6 domain-containing protein [Gallionella sp.]|nr:cytochrome b/b6 domain-containing protein [Gallionella sp.]